MSISYCISHALKNSVHNLSHLTLSGAQWVKQFWAISYVRKVVLTEPSNLSSHCELHLQIELKKYSSPLFSCQIDFCGSLYIYSIDSSYTQPWAVEIKYGQVSTMNINKSGKKKHWLGPEKQTLKVKVLGKYKSLQLFKLTLNLVESMRESRKKVYGTSPDQHMGELSIL